MEPDVCEGYESITEPDVCGGYDRVVEPDVFRIMIASRKKWL